jgi:cytoskeletal protein RodZ
LEADRFDKLPSLAYIRGFLRIYSRELGLDPKAILREFQPNSAEVEDSILDLRPEMLESLPTRAAEPVVTSRKLGFGVLAGAAVFVLAVLGIQMYRVWPVKSPKDPSTLAPIGADQKTEGSGQNQEAKTKAAGEEAFVKAAVPVKPAEAVAQTTTPPAPATTLPPVQSSDQAPPKPAVPHQLRIYAKKDTWVRIVAVQDGKEEVLFEDTIDEDEMMPRKRDDAWTGDSFIVTTREAADAEIIFNDSNFGTYEKPGPQTFRLPAR